VRRLALLVVLAAACGDGGHKQQPDAGATPDAPIGMIDAMPDAAMPPATLTSYVIDLVQHHTTATDTAKPYSEFSSLNDPDGSNGSAYAPLF
jgi:hypothetical protein